MKDIYAKLNRKRIRLGDLVALVGSCAQNEREALAALQDLFQSGRVKLGNRNHLKRIRLSA